MENYVLGLGASTLWENERYEIEQHFEYKGHVMCHFPVTICQPNQNPTNGLAAKSQKYRPITLEKNC